MYKVIKKCCHNALQGHIWYKIDFVTINKYINTEICYYYSNFTKKGVYPVGGVTYFFVKKG